MPYAGLQPLRVPPLETHALSWHCCALIISQGMPPLLSLDHDAILIHCPVMRFRKYMALAHNQIRLQRGGFSDPL